MLLCIYTNIRNTQNTQYIASVDIDIIVGIHKG